MRQKDETHSQTRTLRSLKPFKNQTKGPQIKNLGSSEKEKKSRFRKTTLGGAWLAQTRFRKILPGTKTNRMNKVQVYFYTFSRV